MILNKLKRTKPALLSASFAAALFFASCKDTTDTGAAASYKQTVAEDDIRVAVHQVMQDYYLWNDKVPATLDYASFSSAQKVLDSLMYKKLDRWSFLVPKAEWEALSQKGEYMGFGIGFVADGDHQIWAAYVYENSPAYLSGVRRGWRLASINGLDARSNEAFSALNTAKESETVNFEFELPNGTRTNIHIPNQVINAQTVLDYKIIEQDTSKIGYIPFLAFMGDADTRMEAIFSSFAKAGVDELIFDLRYNGGGQLDIAEKIINALAPSSAEGKLMYSLTCNSRHQDKNETAYLSIPAYAKLDLSRVFFITGRGTASASELLINALDPYMNVYQIGGVTNGKPVGMSPIDLNTHLFYPIMFRIANAEGKTDYFGGIAPDAYMPDDFQHQLGDVRESRLALVLQYIRSGKFASPSLRPGTAASPSSEPVRPQGGVRAVIGTF